MNEEQVLNELKQTISTMIAEEVEKQTKKLAQPPAFIRHLDEEVKHERGSKLGRYIVYSYQALTQKKSLTEVISDSYNSYKSRIDGELLQMAKNLSVGDFSGGGALVPEAFSTEIIPLLQEQSVIRQAGARVLPMLNGNLTLPKMTSGSTLYWLAENEKTTKSDLGFDQIKLTAKKANVTVVISNDLLRQSAFDVDTLVTEEITKTIALGEDQAFIRGTGTSNRPKGIYYWTKASNRFNAGGVTEALIKADIVKALKNVMGTPMQLVRPAWLMSPRTFAGLLSLSDANGNMSMLAKEVENRTLLGYPIYVTTLILDTYSTNKSEIYLVDMDKFVIGETRKLDLQVVPYGSYWNGSATISGLTTDETVISGWIEVDCALIYDTAASIIEGVTIGS